MIRDIYDMDNDIFKKMVDQLAEKLNDDSVFVIQVINDAIHEQFIREKEVSR